MNLPVLALLLFFHNGALAGAKVIGPAPTVQACHQGLAQLVKQNASALESHGLQAFGLCVDTTPFGKRMQQQFKPMPKNPADPLSNESFQQTARA